MPWCDLSGQIHELNDEDKAKHEKDIAAVLEILAEIRKSLESKVDILEPHLKTASQIDRLKKILGIDLGENKENVAANGGDSTSSAEEDSTEDSSFEKDLSDWF